MYIRNVCPAGSLPAIYSALCNLISLLVAFNSLTGSPDIFTYPLLWCDTT